MQDLIKKLNELESKASPLEPTNQEREGLNQTVHQFLSHYIDELEENDSYKSGHINEQELDLQHPHSLEDLLIKLNHYFQYGITASSGGHLGYIPGGGIYTAGLGDMIAAVTNEYAGMEFGSPGAVAIERELINWMKSIFYFPKSAVGNLTSGGSIANLIAFTSARDRHNIKGNDIVRSVVYLTEQVHHCVLKAMRIIGLTDVVVRQVPMDEKYRMNTEALEKLIASDKSMGLHPFIVIASAGTTDTGAVDPLNDIASVAKQNNLWFHVDAAYGGFFILTEEKESLFNGIVHADSLVIDPHKGLFLPYGIGAVLIKHADDVLQSHHYVANYMEGAYDGAMNYSPADLSPELTKHFRGLRMWLSLKLHGIDPFKACLSEKLLLTHYFLEKIQKMGFKTGPEPDLSVGYFFYPSNKVFGWEENEFNKVLHQLMLEDGRVFFSTTYLHDKYVIRIAVLSFRTHKTTIDKGLKMIAECLDKTVKYFEHTHHDSNV